MAPYIDDSLRVIAPLVLDEEVAILELANASSRSLRSLNLSGRDMSRTLDDALRARLPPLRMPSMWGFHEEIYGTVLWHAFGALLQRELAEIRAGEWNDRLVSPRSLLGATEGAVWRFSNSEAPRCCALVLPVSRAARLAHSAPLLCGRWEAAGPLTRVALETTGAGPLQSAVEAACCRTPSVHLVASMRLAALPLSYHAWSEYVEFQDLDESFDFGSDCSSLSGDDAADALFDTHPSWVGSHNVEGSPEHERSILLAFSRATSGFSTAPPASMADVDARRAQQELLVLRRGHGSGEMAGCDDFPTELAHTRSMPPLPRTRLEATLAPRWLTPGALCRAWGRTGCACRSS